MARHNSMPMRLQVPSGFFIAKGGATFVPTMSGFSTRTPFVAPGAAPAHTVHTAPSAITAAKCRITARVSESGCANANKSVP